MQVCMGTLILLHSGDVRVCMYASMSACDCCFVFTCMECIQSSVPHFFN